MTGGGLSDAGPGADLLVVTGGGFVLKRTSAPRIALYCNSALHEAGRLDHQGGCQTTRTGLQ